MPRPPAACRTAAATHIAEAGRAEHAARGIERFIRQRTTEQLATLAALNRTCDHNRLRHKRPLARAPPRVGPMPTRRTPDRACKNGAGMASRGSRGPRTSRQLRPSGYRQSKRMGAKGRPIGKFVGRFRLLGVTYSYDCLPNRARGRHDGSLRAQVGAARYRCGQTARLSAHKQAAYSRGRRLRLDRRSAGIADRLGS
jgi:hypothetical protein